MFRNSHTSFTQEVLLITLNFFRYFYLGQEILNCSWPWFLFCLFETFWRNSFNQYVKVYSEAITDLTSLLIRPRKPITFNIYVKEMHHMGRKIVLDFFPQKKKKHLKCFMRLSNFKISTSTLPISFPSRNIYNFRQPPSNHPRRPLTSKFPPAITISMSKETIK